MNRTNAETSIIYFIIKVGLNSMTNQTNHTLFIIVIHYFPLLCFVVVIQYASNNTRL